MTLLEESWSELFLLCSIQWSLPYDKSPIFSLPESEMVSIENIAFLKHLTAVFHRFKKFNVNPAEFACLKAIIIFKSGKYQRRCIEHNIDLRSKICGILVKSLCYAALMDERIGTTSEQ